MRALASNTPSSERWEVLVLMEGRNGSRVMSPDPARGPFYEGGVTSDCHTVDLSETRAPGDKLCAADNCTGVCERLPSPAQPCLLGLTMHAGLPSVM